MNRRGEHPQLDAAAAVAGIPPTTTTATLLALLGTFGVAPEVVANVTAVRIDPTSVEVDVGLLAVQRGPLLTVRIPVTD